MAVNNQSQKAYQELRRVLIARTLPPNTRLGEESWAERVEVNRGAIRQALAQLFAEGLLSQGARGGFFTRDYTSEEIRETNEARLILEIGAARLAVERVTPEDLRDLDSIADHMILMAQQGYEMGLSEVDIRFHETMVRAAHNVRLNTIYERANIPITLNTQIPEAQMREYQLKVAQQHKQMVESLRKKDLAALESLLVRGLDTE